MDNTESTLKIRLIFVYYIFFLYKLKPPVQVERGKRVFTKSIGGFRRRLEWFWCAWEAFYEGSGGVAAATACCNAFFC